MWPPCGKDVHVCAKLTSMLSWTVNYVKYGCKSKNKTLPTSGNVSIKTYITRSSKDTVSDDNHTNAVSPCTVESGAMMDPKKQHDVSKTATTPSTPSTADSNASKSVGSGNVTNKDIIELIAQMES